MSDKEEDSAPLVMHRWIGVAGLFVAPTTVITAVCYFFGYVSTRKYFAYFGVDSDAIGFSTSDYVVRSISVLYAAILVLLLAWAVLLWAAAYLRGVASNGQRARLLHRLAWAAILVGALGAVRGVVGVLLPRFAPVRNPLLTSIALGLGTVLVVVGFWLLTTSKPDSTPRKFAAAERASLIVAGGVTVMSLFWVTYIFANAYGENQAQIAEAELWTRQTGVIVETTERLDPPANLILETPLTPTAADGASPTAAQQQGITYRYMCFRSLVVRDNQWVLVPAKWTPQLGYAAIITDDSENRISVIRSKDIVESGAVKFSDGWQCPEAAYPFA